MLKHAAIVWALILVAQPALSEDMGLYLGYQGGSYWLNGEFSHGGTRRSDSGRAHGPYAGYRFHRYGAVEVQHLYQKETDERITYEGEVTVVSLRPTLPVNEKWEFYGKLGWAWIDGDLGLTANSFPGERAESVAKNVPLFGLGTRWAMWGLHARVEFQFDGSTLRGEATDIGLYTLGVEYVF
ncbi:MAG: outer membrane beta-barrel protein [Halioglobus sp.]|nr:outer membrane beta-barrel protein [Halioglobus sp.]